GNSVQLVQIVACPLTSQDIVGFNDTIIIVVTGQWANHLDIRRNWSWQGQVDGCSGLTSAKIPYIHSIGSGRKVFKNWIGIGIVHQNGGTIRGYELIFIATPPSVAGRSDFTKTGNVTSHWRGLYRINSKFPIRGTYRGHIAYRITKW